MLLPVLKIEISNFVNKVTYVLQIKCYLIVCNSLRTSHFYSFSLNPYNFRPNKDRSFTFDMLVDSTIEIHINTKFDIFISVKIFASILPDYHLFQ